MAYEGPKRVTRRCCGSDQLRDLHRNPINHPEVFLEPSEALELFNISTSALSAMARDIARLQPAVATTGQPSL